MSETASSGLSIYRNERAPEWGKGVVVGENEGKIVLVFEQGGLRTFKSEMLSKVLSTVPMAPAEARALSEKLRGRKQRSGPATLAEKRKLSAKAAKASANKRAKATFATFDAQLAQFLKLFPEGFKDPRFVAEERGDASLEGKGALKAGGIALAQSQLSPERFEQATPEELFDSAKSAIQATNIAFPIEGAIPFGGIAEEDRAPMLAALKDLLHGEGDYTARFDAFTQSLKLREKSGKAKTATWPLATLLPALYHPTEQVAVKPTYFASQASLVGDELQKSQPVTGAAYQRFLDVALATRTRLEAAGQEPRDLMDVYSFIWRTHSEKPAAATAAPATPAAS